MTGLSAKSQEARFYVAIRNFFRQVDSTQVGRFRAGLGRKWIRYDPDGSDRTCQGYLIQGLVAPRIAGRVGIV